VCSFGKIALGCVVFIFLRLHDTHTNKETRAITHDPSPPSTPEQDDNKIIKKKRQQK